MEHKVASTTNRPSNVHHANNIEAPKGAVTTSPPGTIMIENIEIKINEVRNLEELDPREPTM